MIKMFQDTQQVHHEGLQHESISISIYILWLTEKQDPLVITASIKKDNLFMGSFYLAYASSILCLSLLLFSCVWIVASTLNEDLCKDDRMIKFVNNMMVVFIFLH
jgi:hypothetical protein